MKKKPVTIYDIASELNVSPSTVSRALKNHYSIGKVTTRKVKALAAERGYRPNSLAANPGKRMNNIGVIVPQINQPLASTIISGIEEVAHKNGFNVIIGQSHDALAIEVAFANSFHAARVGGMVLLPSSQEIIEDHFDVFVDDNIPFILLDNKPDVIKLDRIIVDYFTVAKLATAHLIDQGCKRIAMTSDTLNKAIHDEKLRGYQQALWERNIVTDEKLIIVYRGRDVEDGHACASHLLNLSEPPDGIFAHSDELGVGIIQCASERGIAVPQELSVVGFSDDPICQVINPTLSTIAYPARQMGAIAAQEVLDQINGAPMYSKTVVLDTKLIVRQSSLKRNHIDSAMNFNVGTEEGQRVRTQYSENTHLILDIMR